jgi:hypothetical protein
MIWRTPSGRALNRSLVLAPEGPPAQARFAVGSRSISPTSAVVGTYKVEDRHMKLPKLVSTH